MDKPELQVLMPFEDSGGVDHVDTQPDGSNALGTNSQVPMGVGLGSGSNGDMLDLLQPNKFLDGDDDDLSKFIAALHADAVFSKYFPDDEEQDPDYDFLAGALEIDDNEKETEEYRADRAVKISRREVQLLQKSQRQYDTQGAGTQDLNPATDESALLLPGTGLGLPSLQSIDPIQSKGSIEQTVSTRRVSSAAAAPSGGLALSLPDSLPPLPLPPAALVSYSTNLNLVANHDKGTIPAPPVVESSPSRITPSQRARLADQIWRLAQVLVQFKVYGNAGVDPYNGQSIVNETQQLVDKVCDEARKCKSRHLKSTPIPLEPLFDANVMKDLQKAYSSSSSDQNGVDIAARVIKPLCMPPDAELNTEKTVNSTIAARKACPVTPKNISARTVNASRTHQPLTILPKGDKSKPSVVVRHDGLKDLAVEGAIRCALQGYKWINWRAIPTLAYGKAHGAKPTQRFKLTAPDARFKNSTPERYGDDPVAKWKQKRKALVLPASIRAPVAATLEGSTLAIDSSSKQVQNHTENQAKIKSSASRASCMDSQSASSKSKVAAPGIPQPAESTESPPQQRRQPCKVVKVRKRRKKNAPVSSAWIIDSDDALDSTAIDDGHTLAPRNLSRRSPYCNKERLPNSSKSNRQRSHVDAHLDKDNGRQAEDLALNSAVGSSGALIGQPTAPSEDELSDSEDDSILDSSVSRTPTSKGSGIRRNGQKQSSKGRSGQHKATPRGSRRAGDVNISTQLDRDIFSEDEILDTDDEDFAPSANSMGSETRFRSDFISITEDLIGSPLPTEQAIDGFDEDHLSESEEDTSLNAEITTSSKEYTASTHKVRRATPAKKKATIITQQKHMTVKPNSKITLSPKSMRLLGRRQQCSTPARRQKTQFHSSTTEQAPSKMSGRVTRVDNIVRVPSAVDVDKISSSYPKANSTNDDFEEDSLPETDEEYLSPSHKATRTPDPDRKLRVTHRNNVLDKRKYTATTTSLHSERLTSPIAGTAGAVRSSAAKGFVDNNCPGSRKHRLETSPRADLHTGKFEEDGLSESDDEVNASGGREKAAVNHKRARVDSYSPISRVGGANAIAILSPSSVVRTHGMDSDPSVSSSSASYRSITSSHARHQYRHRDRDRQTNFEQDQLSETDNDDDDEDAVLNGGYGRDKQIIAQYTPAEMGHSARVPRPDNLTVDSMRNTFHRRSPCPRGTNENASDMEEVSHRHRARAPVPQRMGHGEEARMSSSHKKPEVNSPPKDSTVTKSQDYIAYTTAKLNSAIVERLPSVDTAEAEFRDILGGTSASQQQTHTFDVSDLSDTDEE
ncbi:hypothetical protein SARC_07905 [Sphaeroforma arctica JP610]|uniref:Uncharacterized protein n=1 Tax=Sphaeroforma arctica JP610 TaxID=667725 RepID=A0A0L0FT09_9EUKA|nr:hypothetical protein SARC_07905 [Sphaeroforma arctica JP610]KNC79711.1 hypothetical protein SARC_07905 [Sphaeroforma arctica JP610]|eukprot:XP_014153613.1 hypothetical protein SARC_07905 [Sphaeroforma arctica JP610]